MRKKSQKACHLRDIPFSPTPPTIEFNVEGNVIQAWGGRLVIFELTEYEYDIFPDNKDSIWIGVDSKGNIYTAEVRTGKRVQKFNYQSPN